MKNIYKSFFFKREKKYEEKEKNENEKNENEKNENEKNEKELNENTKIPLAKSINNKMKSERSKYNSEINCNNNSVEDSISVKHKPIPKKYVKYSNSIYHPSFYQQNHPNPYYYYNQNNYKNY